MQKFIFIPLALLIIFLFSFHPETHKQTLSAGAQPQLSADKSGNIRLVFGRSDSIFYAAFNNETSTFSAPVFVAAITEMHLGAGSGPQIASSNKYSIITAINEKGNINCFRLNHASNRWQNVGIVNDVPAMAVEGLMSIAADDNDNFYATWLDIRKDKRNNICFSSIAANTGKWRQNKLIYTSPDGHVCECCKPSIDVNGNVVAVMFRNWLHGSRDMYVTVSNNAGKTFGNAQKSGDGTWPLNACPMDGGAVKIGTDGKINTTWRRENTVYFSTPGHTEILIAKGKNCRIALAENEKIISWFNDGQLYLSNMDNKKAIPVGTGNFLTTEILPSNKILCVWEKDKKIEFRIMELANSSVSKN